MHGTADAEIEDPLDTAEQKEYVKINDDKSRTQNIQFGNIHDPSFNDQFNRVDSRRPGLQTQNTKHRRNMTRPTDTQ